MAIPDYLQEASYRYRLDKARVKQQAPTTDQISPHLIILDKNQQLVPFVPNRAQRHYAEHRTGRDLILKPRQIGFSTGLVADMFMDAITRTVMGATLAHDKETTQKLRYMAGRFYDNLPESLRPRRTRDNATTTGYATTGSMITIATAGNTSGGRGGTYSRLHGSEVAYWTDADELMAGIMQGVPDHGIIELESTANGAQGWFYEACNKALKGQGRFKLHFYPWWWADEYQAPLQPGEVLEYTDEEQTLVTLHGLAPEQIKWRRLKIDELGDKFKQEYPEDVSSCFLTSGSSVFNLFTTYVPDEQAALDDHYYTMGIDWSGGGQGDADNHAVSIADASQHREAFLMTTRQRDDDAVLEEIVELAKRWRVTTIAPELNSMGKTLAGRLHKFLHERGYDWGVNSRGESLAPVVSGIWMSNPEKDGLVKDTKEAFAAGYKLVEYVTPDVNADDELRSFVARQLPSGLWTYGAKSGKHDDTVIARMLAIRACKGY
jgi:hypothetical protein